MPDKIDLQLDIGELMTFTGDDEETTIQKLGSCRKSLADEFRAKNPKTTDELYDFYFQTPWYVYDLYSWAHEHPMWELLDKVAEPGMNVLDYGCGIGDVAIHLAEKGCSVTAVDLVSKQPDKVTGKHSACKTFHFAQWRTAIRMLNSNKSEPGKIKFSFDPDKERFDLVLCIDVLEHVHFPLRYIYQLSELLRTQESMFFMTPRFSGDEDGNYPMHLPQYHWLNDLFGEVMVAMAFKPEQVVENYFPVWYPSWLFTQSRDGSGGNELSPSSGKS